MTHSWLESRCLPLPDIVLGWCTEQSMGYRRNTGGSWVIEEQGLKQKTNHLSQIIYTETVYCLIYLVVLVCTYQVELLSYSYLCCSTEQMPGHSKAQDWLRMSEFLWPGTGRTRHTPCRFVVL